MQGQRSWNGVAILAHNAEPVLTRRRLPSDRSDVQSRYIEAAVEGVLVGCIYLPNGNPQPGLKFRYKLAWFERLITHAAELRAAELPVVLAGDYNVVPTDADIYPSKSWTKNALVQPESRHAFRRLLAQGWIDAIRARHPVGPVYTFWDYKRERWARDAGLRIDHILLSATLAERLIDAGVDRDIRGEASASDHAPAWVVLSGGQPSNGSRTRIVSSRSGLVERSVTGASTSSSIRRTYFTAAAGSSAQERAPRVDPAQPSMVS